MGLNVYDMTARVAYMGLNAHGLCNSSVIVVGLIMNEKHVQCVNMYI
jgi:hypothetical protein